MIKESELNKKAKGRSLENFLGNGSVFNIPDYQRKYKWNKQQIEDLIIDIRSLENNEKSLFLGVLLVKYEKEGEVNLIDGQQRVTTFIILYKILKDMISESEVNRKELLDKIENILFKKEINHPNKYRIKMNNLEDESSFRSLIENEIIWSDKNKLKNSESVYYRNYFIIREYIESLNNDPIYWINLLERVWIVSIQVDKKDNELQIFESINSKGLELDSFELIKNYLLRKLINIESYKENKDEKRNKIVKFFEEMNIFFRFSKKENDKKFKSFIGSFIINKVNILNESNFENKKSIKLPKLSSHISIFNSLRNIVKSLYEDFNSSDKLMDFIDDLKNSFVLFKYILDYSEKIDRINNGRRYSKFDMVISTLSQELTSTYYFPLLIDLSSKYLRFDGYSITNTDNEKWKECIFEIDKFIIKNYIVGRAGRTLSRVINGKTIIDVDKLKLFLKKQLEKISTSDYDNSFDNHWKNMNKNAKKSILWRVEYELNNNNNELSLLSDYKNFTIEHIMPQKLSEDWINDLTDWGLTNLEKIDEHHSKYLNRLGNLTITKNNSRMSNYSFKIKSNDHYSKSSLLINKKICEFNKWTSKEIEQRNQELAKMIRNIWLAE